MKNKIASIIVIAALCIACFATLTGETIGSNEYGRMIAVTALYDEPLTEPQFEKVSYEDMENIRFESDQLARIEFEDSTEETLTSANIDQNEKNKAALQAILAADKNSKRALAEQRSDQYQLNEIKEISTETINQSSLTINLPQGNAAIAIPVTADASSGTYAGQFVLTGYCPCVICCGKTNGITASGTLATANHTVAADSRFSFGTKLIINGVVYTVEDRGGAIKGNRIDVFFTTHQEALNFGRRTADIYILEQ